MAIRVIRELVDDLDGSDADETVTFAVNGAVYEIDLNEAHAKEFYEFLSGYVEHGRKLPKNSLYVPGRKASSPNGSRAAAVVSAPDAEAVHRPASYARPGKEQNKAIREWARKQPEFKGLPERGRIPKNVFEAFQAAHA